MLGQRLSKSKRIQTSNWAARSLRTEQLVYAANDAHASLMVYEAIAAYHPDWVSGPG